ncbi:MAG: hypothetical protein ABIQ64_00215 [Candidatus Saccharimonadales bacterium]
MKQSERLYADAESKQSIIDGYQKEIDLRAGQIDKLNQEIDSFSDLMRKEQINHDEMVKQANQELAKEEDEKKKQQQQLALNAAQSMASDNN